MTKYNFSLIILIFYFLLLCCYYYYDYYYFFFLENKNLTEPLLLMSQEEDQIEMGAEAHSSFLKHLKEIRQQAEKEFGSENIFSETEAQDVMIGV